ncbi:MAG: hypothetical protein D9V44_10315 [Actinobacteria bacterium]|nr:MAG: hypothetical protein D9V44_10315 [Actinomycetota bacterium]
MQCPTCGSPYEPGQGFCGSCGGQLPAEVPPTQAMPVIEDAAPVEPPAQQDDGAQAEYEREYARYQQEYAAWQAGQAQPEAAPQYPATYPAPGAPVAAAPPKKSKTGLIIALVLGGFVLIGITIAVLALVGLLGFSMPVRSEITEVTESPVEATTPAGFDSAEAAIKAKLPEYGADWVYTVYEESPTAVTFWVGPPASEYAAAVTVSKAGDGSWSITAEEPLDFASDVPGGNVEMSSAEEAASVLSEHLNAVMEDRGMDAHALTVEPFASDGASAGEAAGQFKSFTIDGTTEQSDGSFWVKSTQVWTWGTEKWQYWLVPTEAGYRIADVKEW